MSYEIGQDVYWTRIRRRVRIVDTRSPTPEQCGNVGALAGTIVLTVQHVSMRGETHGRRMLVPSYAVVPCKKDTPPCGN